MLFPILDIIFEKELIREKVGIFFYLGACEVVRSLQARLAGLHKFYDWMIDISIETNLLIET